ncbi:MAG: 3-hydroxyacyl-CoA dehydrogenase family protein [Polyangiales bacterium]
MDISRIAVVGCGRMGRGIALLAAQHKLQVIAVPGRAGGQERSRERFSDDRARVEKRGGAEAGAAFDRIEVVEKIEDVTECALWIESIVERLDTKQATLKAIEAHVAPGTVIATNTSSLPLEVLAEALARPESFLALHFFNPATRMKLVEVGATAQTGPEAVRAANAFCEQIDQTPIAVRASPGYVVNRLLVPMLLHAIQTFESGVANADAIDAAMQLGLSHPMGPLALADYIGLDVVIAMATTMREELGDPRFDLPPLLVKLVELEQLGRKSKVGFYDYRGKDRIVNSALAELIS